MWRKAFAISRLGLEMREKTKPSEYHVPLRIEPN